MLSSQPQACPPARSSRMTQTALASALCHSHSSARDADEVRMRVSDSVVRG